MNEMEYTAVIRTLGTAGDKYQRLLNSLVKQTVPPAKIVVYIAEGYACPKETVGREQYVYVKKGMVAQRALPYDEVTTKYMLFLDDDVYLPDNAVEMLHKLLVDNEADVISPDVFPNAERSTIGKLMMMLSGRMVARKDDDVWGYKVMRNAGYSYNSNPKPGVYLSQTNAGPCFFCRKADFLAIHFEQEKWLDSQKYPIGEDQVMYYKMYLSGLKQLTWFGSGIEHLDAGSTLRDDDKSRRLIYADFWFKTVFWHRFIHLPEKSRVMDLWNKCCLGYTFAFALLVSLVKGQIDIYRIKLQAMKSARDFIKSDEYKSLPLL